MRWKNTTPINTAVMFVPQQEAWVVERMGKFSRHKLNFFKDILLKKICSYYYIRIKKKTIDKC